MYVVFSGREDPHEHFREVEKSFNPFATPTPDFSRSVLGPYEADVATAKSQGIRYKRWAERHVSEETGPHDNGVAKYWFSTTAVSRPHLLTSGPALKVLNVMRAAYEAGDAALLKELSHSETANCRETIQALFNVRDREIIFERNGTSATHLVGFLLASSRIIATNEQGRLIDKALLGKSTHENPFDFKQQIGLFCPQTDEARHSPDTVETLDLLNRKGDFIGDETFLENMRAAIRSDTPTTVFIPHVSRSGRILPVQAVRNLINEWEVESGVKHRLVVDACQAVGRLTKKEIEDAIDASDGYFFVGQKALCTMVSSVLICKNEVMESARPRLEENAHLFRFFQFDASEKYIARKMAAEPTHASVSIPEIASLNAGLEIAYGHLNLVEETRKEMKGLIDAAKQVLEQNGVRLVGVDGAGDMVSSIIPIRIRHGHEIKGRIQEMHNMTVAPVTNEGILRIGLSNIFVYLSPHERWHEAIAKFIEVATSIGSLGEPPTDGPAL